ncbi:MAG: hypothetical protein ACQESN_11900, partial [Thermotogota bacterium]
MKLAENRKFIRYDCNDDLVVYDENNPKDYDYCVSLNYSRGGMYVRANTSFDPKNKYVIKLLSKNSNNKILQGTQQKAYIRWFKPLKPEQSTGIKGYFDYGFEYI